MMREKETSIKCACRCIKFLESAKRDVRIKFKMLNACVTAGDSFIHNVCITQFDLHNCLFTYVPINCAFIVFLKMFYTYLLFYILFKYIATTVQTDVLMTALRDTPALRLGSGVVNKTIYTHLMISLLS